MGFPLRWISTAVIYMGIRTFRNCNTSTNWNIFIRIYAWLDDNNNRIPENPDAAPDAARVVYFREAGIVVSKLNSRLSKIIGNPSKNVVLFKENIFLSIEVVVIETFDEK